MNKATKEKTLDNDVKLVRGLWHSDGVAYRRWIPAYKGGNETWFGHDDAQVISDVDAVLEMSQVLGSAGTPLQSIFDIARKRDDYSELEDGVVVAIVTVTAGDVRKLVNDWLRSGLKVRKIKTLMEEVNSILQEHSGE